VNAKKEFLSEAEDKVDLTNIEAAVDESRRNLKGYTLKIFTVIAISMSIYHLYVLGVNPVTPWVLYTVHVGMASILIFIMYPPFKKSKGNKVTIIDLALIMGTLFSGSYLILEMDELIYRIGVSPTNLDIIVSIILIAVVLEITRRTTGMILPTIAIIFILYAYFGNNFPGVLEHRGYGWGRILTYLNSLDGVFSVPISASASFVFLFILFGAFLNNSGGSKFFIDFAIAVAGGQRGGPAKAAVLSSALFGSVSGNSVANVVTTGVFTIPLMKKIGYPAKYSGAIESVASTGGQIMPPILGSAAFIMAQLLGKPYVNIIIASIIPALLYFVTVIITIDLQAGKLGLKGMKKKELPSLKKVLINEGHLFIPLFVLIFVLAVLNASPIKAAIWAIISSIVVSFLKKATRLGFKKILKSLSDGAENALGVIAACATAGLIIGVLNLTGAGLKFASLIISFSGGYLFIALILTMIATIILGMGLPTTAAYLITAAVVAPALVEMGVSPLAAHMFVFYFACLSAFTPPVALAAFAAAGISKSSPMSVALNAMKIGAVAFVIPFIFVYGPELLFEGRAFNIILAIITSLIGAYVLASAIEGWFINFKVNILIRIILGISSILLFIPSITNDVIGMLSLLLSILLTQLAKKQVQIT